MTCAGTASADVDAEKDGAGTSGRCGGVGHLEEAAGGVGYAVGVIDWRDRRSVFLVKKWRRIGPRSSFITGHFSFVPSLFYFYMIRIIFSISIISVNFLFHSVVFFFSPSPFRTEALSFDLIDNFGVSFGFSVLIFECFLIILLMTANGDLLMH